MTYLFKTMYDLYLEYCKYEKNLSSLTLKAYQLDIKQFTRFIEEKAEPHQVNKELIRNYLHYLFERHLKATSIRRKMVCLKSFFTFLESEGRIGVNPFEKIKLAIRIPKKIPEIMNLDDVMILLGLPRKDLEEIKKCAFHEIDFSRCIDYRELQLIQNIVILEILFATGMRVKELSNLNIDDIDTSRKIVKVNGKGDKQRIMPIPTDGIVHLLTSYISLRTQQDPGAIWLFTNRFNKRMRTPSIRAIVHKYAIRAKFQKRVTPHTFRHTTATMLLENGTDIRFVQALLGHTSITTTQLYTHVSEIAQRRVITLNHPRNLF